MASYGLMTFFLQMWIYVTFTNGKSIFRDIRSNTRPIIGLALKPFHDSYADEFVEAGYVKYLEAAGARVVPIRGKRSMDYYDKLFNNINGVLFPGGSADLSTSTYAFIGRFMYTSAIKANNDGDYFPIWGTCLGFELLTNLTAEENLLKSTDTENMTLPLDFTKSSRSSHLLKKMPEDMIYNLANHNLTQNNHHYSLLLDDFEQSDKLSNFYNILSTSTGRDHTTFVSLIEAKKYPFYGAQFHPEKSIFKWNPSEAINHSFQSIQASQYLANFFVNEARKSQHKFDTVTTEAHVVIENDLDLFVSDQTFQENYYFNYTQTSLYFKTESNLSK